MDRMDLYKKQFNKWGWKKYLPAGWMLNKARKRRLEGKDTEFEFRGKAYTEDELRDRFPNKEQPLESASKFSGEYCWLSLWTGTNNLDAPTPAGLKYATSRNDHPSPNDVIASHSLGDGPTWQPPIIDQKRLN